MLRVGDIVAERYRVEATLGSGGMGTVWRAHHLELAIDVALKVIGSEVTDPELLRRFKREAQASARLKSPHIVKVLDYGVHDGRPYLAMELLDGEDLSARIQRKAKLSVDETRAIVRGLTDAMQIAHDAGIVHRDLKPANIFLERAGDSDIVKVFDFGVAKDLRADEGKASSTTGAAVVGSPAYMSPEQVWGEGVDHRSDVWAMGVVIFEMLTGVSPFDDATLAKVFENIVRAPLPLAREHEPCLPEGIERFLQRALARDRDDRFTSAKELASELEAVFATDSTSPPVAVRALGAADTVVERVVAPERPAEPTTQARRRVLLGGFAVALAASAVTATVVRSSRSGPTAVGPPADVHTPLEPTVASAAAAPVASAAPSALPPPSSTAREAPRIGRARPATPSASASSKAPPFVDPTFGIPSSP